MEGNNRNVEKQKGEETKMKKLFVVVKELVCLRPH